MFRNGRDDQNLHRVARVGTEAAAALIIGFATLEATISALLLFLPASLRHSDDDGPQAAKEQVRLRLGRWLAVALEFELGADILRTAVAPTWSEIGQIAAIAAIRTLLNYFLQQEIDKAEERSHQAPGSASPIADQPRDRTET